MTYESIRLKQRDGVARLVLDRPPVNVLNIAMMREMADALDTLADDPEVRLLLLTGAGKAFCAGVDVGDHTADRVRPMLETFHAVVRGMLVLPFPVIAAVNGAALGGGCELLMACDIVLASDRARLGQPEIKLAVFPPAAAVLLPRMVGMQRAMDVILTGRVLTADEAHGMGLVTRVVPSDDFEAAVDEYAAGLAELSRPVLRLAKKAVLEAATLPVGDGFERAEARYLDDLMSLEDPHEGLAAFLEKRAPAWRDA